MKNKILYIGLFIISAFSFASCKNNLDVLAPGEESVSVYGILNADEPVQKIRINKVFLTSGDAIAAGQDANQINYGPGELLVSLERYLDGVQMNVNSLSGTISSGSPATDKRITLTETVVTTTSGNFNQNQRIWQTNQKIFVTTPTPTAAKQNKTEYKLIIKILSTGKEITAQTVVVDSVKSYGSMPFIYIPNSNPQFAYPMHFPCHSYVLDSPPGTGTKQIAYVDYSNTTITTPFKIRFKSIANARLYNVVMRFHYKNITFPNDTTPHFVDFNFTNQKSATLFGGEDMQVSFAVNDFYTNLAAEIKPVANLKTRVSHYMEYIVYAGDETLNTFLQVNAPSTSIAQDKPYYTNINGGVGVFASRSRSTITKELWSSFVDEIADNPITQSLQFNKNHNIICP